MHATCASWEVRCEPQRGSGFAAKQARWLLGAACSPRLVPPGGAEHERSFGGESRAFSVRNTAYTPSHSLLRGSPQLRGETVLACGLGRHQQCVRDMATAASPSPQRERPLADGHVYVGCGRALQRVYRLREGFVAFRDRRNSWDGVAQLELCWFDIYLV